MSNTGLDAIDRNDLVIPRRALVQNTTDTTGIDEAMPGTFIDSTMRQYVGKSMRAALLMVRKSRALFWDKKANPDKSGIRCASRDGVTPFVENPISPTCEGCPEAFKDLQYDMLFYDIPASEAVGAPVVFWLRSKGASNGQTKTFLSTLITRRKRAYDFTVQITAEKAVGKKGSYYIMKFTDVTVTPESLLPALDEAYELYANQEEEIHEVDEEKAVPF